MAWPHGQYQYWFEGYRKPLLNCVGSLSPSNITTRAIVTGFAIHQKQILSLFQPILAISIDRNMYYLGPLEEIS